MTDALIEHRRIDSMTVLTLCAGKANAFDLPLLDALTRAVDAAVAAGATALIVTGEGATFSGGLALPSLIDLDRAGVKTLITALAVAMRRVLEAPIPVVAAINGNAIAGGCVLALMCDERIMADRGPPLKGDPRRAVSAPLAARGSADRSPRLGPKAPPRIGLNEAQLGLGLPAVVIEVMRTRLPFAAHVPVALEGRLFEPEQAQRIGLVDEVVATAQLETRVIERARSLATAAPIAYAQIKRALLRPTIEAIDRVDSAETEAWLDTWFSAEGQRRMRATVARITKR
ncbi:MAG: enoyl-CoA hydratase/isomerase family protein [Deltaproteobacteria bacterium]|nr:enoyl-CoA hydratase/isomerase family protein [Deltaproteobacteria bacterium]